MLTLLRKFYRQTRCGRIAVLSLLLLVSTQPVWAAGPPGASVFDSPLAIMLLVLMVILMLIIALLAGLLMNSADLKSKRDSKSAKSVAALLILFFLLSGSGVFAQDAGASAQATSTPASIGGLSPTTFYVMVSIIFLELFIIMALLINIRFLVRNEKDKLVLQLSPDKPVAPKINWWSRFNKFKPVEQEADIDLGHDYDGIRELDNRLPPWWLYGFYVTIVFAAIYLWRFHVSHTAPSTREEYEQSVARAEIKIQEYLKTKGEAVNENTVTQLSESSDIAEGKKIFTASCASCHKESGAGDVGPNLTDDYWLHGGDIKSIFKTVKYGINAMPQWQNAYSNKQIAQVASFVKTLKGTNPPNPKAPQGEIFKEAAPAGNTADSALTKEKVVAK
jgi:cytochrome c oxidase cbb3-type subunit 3